MEQPQILIVDDDTDILESTKLLLGDTYLVQTANSVREARDKIMLTNFDAVLVDLRHVLEAGRERVQVDDRIDAIVVLLELDPVLERSEPVAYVQAAGRAHPRKNPFSGALPCLRGGGHCGQDSPQR